MNTVYDTSAPKKATNLTINSDLLAQARLLKINLSALLEQSLAEQVKKRKEEAWLLENEQAIRAYNDHVAEQGTFSDHLRSF